MSGKREAKATVVSAKVVVRIDVRKLIDDELYLKLPDASEIVVEHVDWDETVDWLDNDLGNLPLCVEVVVSE